MSAYYNEHDPWAAQWMLELIKAGHIAEGIVDDRSIEDVQPDELIGFTQCHFFAGIGGWSLALRQAGWPDDRPVWTGSCPCQPFSNAGEGKGFDDERHLWPAWQWLIQQSRPSAIFGEQVASKDTDPWIDLVHADLEAMDYAFGCVPFPAAGIGAPHIRERAFWVGYTSREGLPWSERPTLEREGRREEGGAVEQSSGSLVRVAVRVAHNNSNGRDKGRPGQSEAWGHGIVGDCTAGGVGNTSREPCERDTRGIPGAETASSESRGTDGRHGDGYPDAGQVGDPGPTNAQWADADWLHCRDGKWRPVEPGTFPLAHGLPGRVGRLRGYGNAIVPAQAAEFVMAAEPFMAEQKAIEIIADMNTARPI